MHLYVSDRGISRSLILFGTREVDKKFILENTIKEGMKIFDIGANIGYYTLTMSKILNDSGKILAIEPSQENIDLCKSNIRLNNLKLSNIDFISGAVSDKNHVKDFYIASQSNLHTFHPEGSAKKFLTGEIRKINTYSVKKLSKLFYLPDLIRMDVEGHEVEIISGMLESIKSGLFKPQICFEPHISSYSGEHDFKPILKTLFSLGYKTKFLSSNAIQGTKKIIDYTSVYPKITLKSDGEERALFENLNTNQTIDILTNIGGARTVLLSPLQ